MTLMCVATKSKAGGVQMQLELEKKLLSKSINRYINERECARKENAYEM